MRGGKVWWDGWRKGMGERGDTYPFRVDVVLHNDPPILDPVFVAGEALFVVCGGHLRVCLRLSIF